MATSFPNITVTDEWQDICQINGDLYNEKVMIQNRGTSFVYVYFGEGPINGEEPNPCDGFELKPGEIIEGTSNLYIWVRGAGAVALLVGDA
jgi:hypothetical protein